LPRVVPGLSSDAPELALELFNLVRATSRGVIGQLESTRRATFLGARFPKSATEVHAGLHFSVYACEAIAQALADGHKRDN
jgi:hypothetical protein